MKARSNYTVKECGGTNSKSQTKGKKSTIWLEFFCKDICWVASTHNMTKGDFLEWGRFPNIIFTDIQMVHAFSIERVGLVNSSFVVIKDRSWKRLVKKIQVKYDVLEHLHIYNTFVCSLDLSSTIGSTNMTFFTCLPQDRTTTIEKYMPKDEFALLNSDRVNISMRWVGSILQSPSGIAEGC